MLQQDRVADRDVRGRETCDLVVRKVPRHDAEQRAERRPPDDRRPLAEDVDRLVGGDLRGVVGVELRDVRGEVHFAQGRREGLAHLAHDDLGELFPTLAVQVGHAVQALGTLGNGCVASPVAIGGRGGGD